MKNKIKPNQNQKRESNLHMVGVMLSDSYIEKLKHLLFHNKRTCRGQIMAWIDEETRLIAKERRA